MGDKGESEKDAVKYYRLSEVEKQNTFKSTWIIINNKVYDVTQFLEEVRRSASQSLRGEGEQNNILRVLCMCSLFVCVYLFVFSGVYRRLYRNRP